MDRTENPRDGFHPPIVPCRSWPSSMKVFNLLFIMSVKDVPSLRIPFRHSSRSSRLRCRLGVIARAPVCVCVFGSVADRPCTHAPTCTRQNARLRACWGLRSVSLCACTCSRVRGAALTARRVAEGDGKRRRRQRRRRVPRQ